MVITVENQRCIIVTDASEADAFSLEVIEALPNLEALRRVDIYTNVLIRQVGAVVARVDRVRLRNTFSKVDIDDFCHIWSPDSRIFFGIGRKETTAESKWSEKIESLKI